MPGLLTLYNVGGVVCAILLAGLFAARVARLRGHELRITIPIGVAVVAGGLATALSDTAAAAGDHGHNLWAFYAWEDLLLVCVPASFILSYVLRRVCIEELSGRIDAYDTLPQACAKLQRALRDPTLQILLPGTSPGQWVDAEGRRQPAPTEGAGRCWCRSSTNTRTGSRSFRCTRPWRGSGTCSPRPRSRWSWCSTTPAWSPSCGTN